MTTVLVVDDEEPIREFLIDVLHSEGYRVLAASDGKQALALALREQPVLVLADVMMPVMTGTELCRCLKREHADLAVRVVLMSAALSALTDDTEADAFLPKPFDLDHLLALIAEYAGPPRGG
ncbi:MAG: response regulator [Chloroflexi bacterium]|jgi:CheY-like chemotaxis protein|nr:response regulator [Chloroflexota bacterium]